MRADPPFLSRCATCRRKLAQPGRRREGRSRPEQTRVDCSGKAGFRRKPAQGDRKRKSGARNGMTPRSRGWGRERGVRSDDRPGEAVRPSSPAVWGPWMRPAGASREGSLSVRMKMIAVYGRFGFRMGRNCDFSREPQKSGLWRDSGIRDDLPAGARFFVASRHTGRGFRNQILLSERHPAGVRPASDRPY